MSYLEHLVVERVEQAAQELLGVLLAALLRAGEGAQRAQHAAAGAALQRGPGRHRGRRRRPARASGRRRRRRRRTRPQRTELVAQLHPVSNQGNPPKLHLCSGKRSARHSLLSRSSFFIEQLKQPLKR